MICVIGPTAGYPRLTSSLSFAATELTALMSVIAKWYLPVIVPMLKNTQEPNGLGRLQVGAGTGVMWELQMLVANLLQMHREWEKSRREEVPHRVHRYKTMYLANLDVNTAFDAAQQGTITNNLKETAVQRVDHGGAAGGDEEPHGKGKESSHARRNSETHDVCREVWRQGSHCATWRQHRGRVEVGCGSEGQGQGTPDLHNIVGRHLWMLSDSKHDPQRIMGDGGQARMPKKRMFVWFLKVLNSLDFTLCETFCLLGTQSNGGGGVRLGRLEVQRSTFVS